MAEEWIMGGTYRLPVQSPLWPIVGSCFDQVSLLLTTALRHIMRIWRRQAEMSKRSPKPNAGVNACCCFSGLLNHGFSLSDNNAECRTNAHGFYSTGFVGKVRLLVVYGSLLSGGFKASI